MPTPIKGRNGGTLMKLEKGETANPNGRPKKLPELEKMMADILGTEKEKNMTYAMAILRKLREKALKGDLKAAEMLLNRGYGLVKQEINAELKTDNELVIKIIRDHNA